MSKATVIGLCMAAVFGLTALAAETAAAAPEFHTCVRATEKVKGGGFADGEYGDKNCGVAKAHGAFKLGAFSEARKAA